MIRKRRKETVLQDLDGLTKCRAWEQQFFFASAPLPDFFCPSGSGFWYIFKEAPAPRGQDYAAPAAPVLGYWLSLAKYPPPSQTTTSSVCSDADYKTEQRVRVQTHTSLANSVTQPSSSSILTGSIELQSLSGVLTLNDINVRTCQYSMAMVR